MLRMTELKIAPRLPFESVSETNPLRAVVKLNGENSSVECVLDEGTMIKILDLCADEIANAAAARVAEFRNTVLAIDGEKSTALLGN